MWDTLAVDAPTVVAVGGDLRPQTLLAAYRAGCFPWPPGGPIGALALQLRYAGAAVTGRIHHLGPPGWARPWYCPDPRAVLPADRLHLSRSLRSRLRRCGWTTTVDVDFPAVVAGCADRPNSWIDPTMADAYTRLHRSGHAHSVEVWAGDRLVGGLYGVQVGAVFCGESMFHRVTDASKAALADLGRRFHDAGGLLIDCQEPTGHLAQFGLALLRRAEFVELLRRVRDLPVRLAADRLPVARLA